MVTGSEVKLEVGVEINGLLTNLHHLPGSLLNEVFPENGHEQTLNAIDFLNDQTLAEPDAQFEGGVEFGILVVQNFNVVRVFAQVRFQPFSCLSRWINDQGRSKTVLDDDSVLNAERVSGQSLLLPREHLGLTAQEVLEGVVLHPESSQPALDGVLPHILVSTAEVGHEGRGQEGTLRHQGQFLLDAFDLLFPALVFAGELAQELLGGAEGRSCLVQVSF